MGIILRGADYQIILLFLKMMKNLHFRNLLLLMAVVALLFSSCSDEQDETFIHPLQALENQPAAWKWFDIDGMQCRDGSETGIVVRMNDPKKLVIYINGGGACFNVPTCASNPKSFNEQDAENLASLGDPGIFSAVRTENPVKDWSFVFIPYCTGDVHSGRTENGKPLGVNERQKFVGNINFNLVMEFIAPYFLEHDVDEILFFGLSAGGYGVYINALDLIKYFPGIKTTVINDSGPIFKDADAFPLCLQLGFNFIFDIPIPADFLYCCLPDFGLGNVYQYAATKYPDYNYGFVSSLEDGTSRYFLGFGQETCTGQTQLPAATFRNAMINLRDDNLRSGSKWSTFYIDGNSHTLLASNELYYNRPVEGMYLYEWVDAVLKGQVNHVSEE